MTPNKLRTQRSPLPAIAITIGDPAGVGPEIALRAAQDPAVTRLCQPFLLGSRALLKRVAKKLKLNVPSDIIDPTPEFSAAAVIPGTVQAENGAHAARWVEAAIDGCRAKRFAAMVTGPLNKEALAAGGVPFPGHTELLAHRCGVTSARRPSEASPTICVTGRSGWCDHQEPTEASTSLINGQARTRCNHDPIAPCACASDTNAGGGSIAWRRR